MSEDARDEVMAMHAKLAAGDDPRQKTFETCRRVAFTVKDLDWRDVSASTSLQINDFVFPETVRLYRDEAGKACMALPSISFRIMTYSQYSLAPEITTVCLDLADQILPKLRPLGRNRGTRVEITTGTPLRFRLLEDFNEARRRVLGKTFCWQATATAD